MRNQPPRTGLRRARFRPVGGNGLS